jgi:formylglycine-generating enzyme
MEVICIRAKFSTSVRFLSILFLAVWALTPPASAQPRPSLGLQISAGQPTLSLTGAVGTVYSIQYATGLSPTNLWVDRTLLQAQGASTVWTDLGPTPGQRFYRAVSVAAPADTNLVFIQPGTFVMGSPTSEADRKSDETQHTVTLTQGFYIGKYQVTQGEYLALMGSNPSYFTTNDDNGKPIPPDLNRPVERVSWIDATNYCGHLTQQEQAAGRLPSGWVYRLPTESEREYACRAGTTTAFNFGSAIHGGMANFYDYYEYDASIGDIHVANPAIPCLPRTTTVGSYAPNPWGLYDMHGNVFEWCRDWYGDYPTGSVVDPQGALTGSYRVFRGGGWKGYGQSCRSARRHPGLMSGSGSFVGFRVVLALGQP